MRIKDQLAEAPPEQSLDNPLLASWLEDVRLLLRRHLCSDERLMHEAMCMQEAKAATKAAGGSLKRLLSELRKVRTMSHEELFEATQRADAMKALRDDIVAITDAPIHLGWSTAWSRVCANRKLLHRIGNILAERDMIRPFKRASTVRR